MAHKDGVTAFVHEALRFYAHNVEMRGHDGRRSIHTVSTTRFPYTVLDMMTGALQEQRPYQIPLNITQTAKRRGK